MANRSLLDFLTDNRTFNHVVSHLKSIHIHKKEVSWYDFIRVFIHNFKNDEINTRASAVAFNFTLAIFPALIFLFTLIPYIPIPDLYEKISELISDIAVLERLDQTIQDIISKPRAQLLSFSVLLSLYLATNGMIALMQAFNKIYRTIEKRGFLKTWTIAVSLTVLLSTSLFLAISLLIVGQFILKFLTENGFLTQDLVILAIFALRFIVIFITFLLVLSTIYYFAPALHEKWKFISPGSLVATILTMLVSYLFSFYVGNFDSYNKLYGSIGTMIALMVWLYLVSMIILSGFEINASLEQAIHRAKRFRNKD